MANIIKPRSSLIVRYPADNDNIIYAGPEYIIPFEFDEIGLSNPSQLNVYVSYKKASTGEEVELQYTTDTKDYVIEAFVGDAFNQSINADLDNYGYLRMTRTITDVECLYIYRKTEVSQLKDFNTNSYSMASIGEAVNKITMILQEQGGLTPAIRIPETVMIENNISAPIKYNSYVPNCLLGTKDNPSEIVPYYPDGVTLTFNKGIVTDEEGNEQEVNNGLLSSHVCVYKVDHDNGALFFIPASLCRIIPNKGIEVLQQINILPGNAMSMSLEEGITPSGGTPSGGTPSGGTPSDVPSDDDDDAPAPQSMKFLKIDGADVEAKDNYIIVTNSQDGNGNITAWNVGVNLPELERLINSHIPSGQTIQEVYRFDRLLEDEEQQNNNGLRSYLIAEIQTLLPELALRGGALSILRGILSEEDIEVILRVAQGHEGEITAAIAGTVLNSLRSLTTYLPTWMQWIISQIPALNELTDETKIHVVNCIVRNGRFNEVNERTGEVNCTLSAGTNIGITDNGEINNKLKATHNIQFLQEENNQVPIRGADVGITQDSTDILKVKVKTNLRPNEEIDLSDMTAYDYVKEYLVGVKDLASLKGDKGDPGEKGDKGENPSPAEIQNIVNTFLETPQNPVTVNVKNIVEDVSNDKTSNTLKPVLYNEGTDITITGGVTKGAGGSTTEGDSFLTTIINGIKAALPIITAIGSVVSPEVAAAIALIDGLTQEQKDQATAGNIENWGVDLVLKLIPALTQFLPPCLQSLIPGNKQQLDNNVNGETYVYTINGRTYTFICPDGSIDINRTDNGKISSQVSLKVSEALKDSLRGRDGQDGKDYFSVRDLPQILTNLGTMGSTEVYPISAGLMIGAGGAVINNGTGEPVDNSPMVPVPSEVIVKSMPTYDVNRDADVIGIKKYTGSATLQGITPTYLAVTSACELLLGISEANSVRLQWNKISIIPPAYNGETQPQVGAFSYSEATGNLLIVCSNVNYIFGVHIGSTFETLTYTIFDTTTYCPSPYGANGGECCAWSGSSSAFFVAPSNNEVTGSLLMISANSQGEFSIAVDSDFDRSQVPGSFDYVKCDLLRSSTTSQNCSDVLLCITSNGYVYRKRYVDPSTFVHSFYIPTLAELSDVSTLEVLGRVPVFSPNVESEIWQQIILFRYKETGNDEWIYKQTVFYNKTRNYTIDLDQCFENNQKPSRLVGECVRARGGTYGEGQVYTQDGKCWWYRPHTTPNSPSSAQLYIDFFWSDGAYDTTNITGANSIRDVIDKEYAIDNTRYWAFNATSNNWVEYVFFTYRYQYQIVRSLYTFDGYLSALANVTVDNTLLQFFMWTQDGGENWSFKTVNDGTDGEYIDCIYGSAGVLFIPKEWNTNIRYAVLRTLNSEVEKKTINDDYGYAFGGFVIQNDNKLKYCILYSEEERQIDGELLLLTTNDISDPLTWEQDVGFGSSDGTEFETPIEQIKKKTYFSTGILPYSNPTLYSNAVVIVPKDLGNGFILWLDKGTSSLFNVIFDEDEFVMPIGGATFDEQGFALLVNKYNNASNLYQQSQIYYYLSPNDNSGYISEGAIINNLKVYDIPSVQSYKPERLIYNRLTSLWTLFYKKQTASSSEQDALIIYTASNLEELVSGTPKILSGTQDIELDMLIQNQYGFFSFGNCKAMLSATPKTVFNLLDNYFNLLDNYVQKTTTINNKALSSNVTLTASDVGALPSNGTATKAISDQYGQNIADTYVTQQSILQMLSPNIETTSGMIRVYSEIINSLNKKIRELCTKAGISTDGLPPVYTSSLL